MKDYPLDAQISADQSPLIACVTDRGIPKRYWEQFDCYELSVNDLTAKPSTLRRWREAAPEHAEFIARVDSVIAKNAFRGAVAEDVWDKALHSQQALDASALLLHTPSTLHPSPESCEAMRSWVNTIDLPCPLAWRADGLWEESEVYFELCAELDLIPVIDPLMWDEEEDMPKHDQYYWRILGGQGLSTRLSDFDLDQLLDLCEKAKTSQPKKPGWVIFSSSRMMREARRWRELLQN